MCIARKSQFLQHFLYSMRSFKIYGFIEMAYRRLLRNPESGDRYSIRFLPGNELKDYGCDVGTDFMHIKSVENFSGVPLKPNKIELLLY